ncbi:MAG: hypothetical protein WA865_18395 [Spirulinaceae cyanobacterium]
MINLKGYKTQAADTTIEAELVQFELWRRMKSERKYKCFKRLLRRGTRLVLMSLEQQFPNVSSLQFREYYLKKRWRTDLINLSAYYKSEGKLVMEDALWLAEQVITILESLGISYYIGGSVASSLQGEMRYTEDLDLVVDLQPQHKQALVAAMVGDYYISEIAVEDAIEGRSSSFNIIHLETTEKADIFVMRKDDFSRIQMSRRQLYQTGNEAFSLYICTSEDSILQKLLWYRMTARESQKQWRDILGVLKLQRERLDFSYLWHWGEKLGILQDLDQAFIEAGL